MRHKDARKGDIVSQTVGDERPHLLAQSLRRYVAVVVVLTVLGGLAAAVYAASRPEVYTSSARILLRPSTGNPYSSQTGGSSQQVTIAMTTEAALVNSEPVLAQVNTDLSPDLEATAVAVTVPPNTSTIVTTVQASSAADAEAGAQAVAEGYLAYRQNVTTATRKASLDQLNAQIATVRTRLAKASDKAVNQPTGSQASRQAQVLTEQLVSLQDLANSASSIDTDPGTLVTPASPATRTGISTALLVAAGAVVGLLVGMGVAVWLGRRDRRVHGRESSTVAGVPVLAFLEGGSGARGAVADRQAYQRLRTSVLASSALPSAVAVSGIGAKDSSGPIALELAHSMTRAGYRVVLVLATAEEPDPVTPGQPAARGLADALRDQRPVSELLVEQDQIAFLPAGSGILEQQELLSGEHFAHVVGALKSTFDYVLVVTGPVMLPAELATARLADILLMVGRDGVTSRVDVGDVSSRAHLVGLRVGGLVLRGRRAGHAPSSAARSTPSGSATASTGDAGTASSSKQSRRDPRPASERR